jgi:hypothetical protein
MNYTAIVVQIPHCVSNLLDNMPGQSFRKVRQMDNLLKQLPAVDHVKNEVVEVVTLNEVLERDYVRVGYPSHDSCLF